MVLLQTVLIGLLLVFLGVFLTFAVDYQTGSLQTIQALSLHPITAFSFGLLEIGRLEDQGIGLNLDTMKNSGNPSGFHFALVLEALAGDIVLWGLVMWYLNRVITPDFGQALIWYFPFTPSYWSCGSNKVAPPPLGGATGLEDTDEQVNDGSIPIEGVSDGLRKQSDSNIVIRHLGKQFRKKTAVENVSMTMYSGQVTALLGHNGA